MCSSKYNIQLDKLCHECNLGEILAEPSIVTGGFLHKLYAVETTKGKFAIKALNPQIMLRPNVLQNQIKSEKIAVHFSSKISALTALRINDNVLQLLDEQYYMIFNWIDGVTLNLDNINQQHCKQIGQVLGTIHASDFSQLNITPSTLTIKPAIDWNHFLSQAKQKHLCWYTLMNGTLENLYLWHRQALEAEKLLSFDRVISHRDMDPKNVLWNHDKPIIIDWESAGYVNPMQELMEVLMYWSVDSKGSVVQQKFSALLNGYKENKNINKTDWESVLHSGYLSKLEWLEYSVKRSLGIECSDEQEQALGTSQVVGTINSLVEYAHLIPVIKQWLME
jgi:Ser/Thr protein kinase RdoA (MazF antagonist)